MSVLIGDVAPDFSLYDSDKNLVTLHSLRGKQVVLLFFPLAFTSTCTKELCMVRDDISRYDNLNAIVLGISVDSLYTLSRYKLEQNLNFRLLSDFNKDVSVLYDALYPQFGFGMRGVSKRAAFVIDENGTVKYAEVLENASEIPSFDRIQDALKTVKTASS